MSAVTARTAAVLSHLREWLKVLYNMKIRWVIIVIVWRVVWSRLRYVAVVDIAGATHDGNAAGNLSALLLALATECSGYDHNNTSCVYTISPADIYNCVNMIKCHKYFLYLYWTVLIAGFLPCTQYTINIFFKHCLSLYHESLYGINREKVYVYLHSKFVISNSLTCSLTKI